MNKDLSAVQHIAHMMYSGQTVLEPSREKFWANTRFSSQGGIEGLSSVSVRYMPRPVVKGETLIGVDYGVAVDNGPEEFQERVANAVKQAHEQLYMLYFLDVRQVLTEKIGSLLGLIDKPKRDKSFAIYAQSFDDLRDKLSIFHMAARNSFNTALADRIADIDVAGFYRHQNHGTVVAHFTLPGYGCALRTLAQQPPADILNITALIYWLGDPAARTFRHEDIQAVIDYNKL